MTKKRNIIHPNFILGLLSQLLLFAAGIYIANNNEWGNTIAIIALIMAATHWVLSMIDAWKDPDLKNFTTTTIETIRMHLDSAKAIKSGM